MDSNLHIEILPKFVLHLLLELLNSIDHIKASLNNFIGLVKNLYFRPFALVQATIVAHDDILIPVIMDLVNPIVITELIEPTENL